MNIDLSIERELRDVQVVVWKKMKLSAPIYRGK